jgi:hypothetical protein
MTWNELIFELQQIPEDRREEHAVFYDGQGGVYPIDAKEELDMDEATFGCNEGNDTTNTSWAITG